MYRSAILIFFVACIAIGVCAKDIDQNMLGTGDHDLKPHHQVLLGGDDHDLVQHGKPLLGGDDHDRIPHGKPLLGGDDHDRVPHSKPLLGTGDHDMKPHGKQHLLGGDDHDMKPHGKPLLGTGDHDKKPHGKHLLGGDDHDMKPHGKPLLGTGDHDMKPHGKHLLGGDDHDLKPHGKQGQEKKPPKKVPSGGIHDKKKHKKHFGVDGHDFEPHKKVFFGKGDHDRKAHKKPLLGGDDHDKKKHGKSLLGGDDHDKKKHGKFMLGRDDHDKRKHGKALLGGDGHDLRKHGKPAQKKDHDKKEHKKLLGADGHDLKQFKKGLSKHGKGKLLHKKKLLGKDSHDKKIHKKHQFKGTHDLKKLKMFHTFMKDFKKSYKSEAEYKRRFNIFHDNMRKVHVMQHNEQGSAKYGPTKFADFTEKEFRKMLGFRPELKKKTLMTQKAKIPNTVAPESFDWRDHGVVTDVKNQGMCGSCWAFSVTGNVEGQWAIKHNTLYSLSEQELVDCDTLDEGCNGGLPENAYQSIETLGGLETETAYPYDGEDEQCHLDESKIKVKVNGSVEIDQDEKSIAQWLVANGPISIGINANALQFYMGGVSHPLKFLCNPEDLDHGMLIVGYGVHTTKFLHRKQPYWIVKNSWGPDWGEEGYYRVYRGDGTCGVNRMATSAIVP